MLKIEYNKTCVVLGICWVLFEQCFYLLPSTIGGIYLQDIAIIILLLYILWSAVSYGVLLDVHNDVFSALSIFFEFIIIIAAVRAYFHWGQGFLTSILPERYLVVILFSYLTIKMSLDREEVSSAQLFKMLLFLGKLELVIMMLQFAAQFAGIYFLQISYNNTLYTFARFGIDGTTMLLTVFCEISNLFNEERRNWKNLIWIAMGVMFFFFMFQTRMTLIGICVALTIFYLTKRTSAQNKVLMTVFFIIAGIFIWNSTLFQDTVNIQEIGARNTMDIRVAAMTFYVDELTESPIFGAGAYPNSDIADSDRNRDSGFGLNDNGLFGFAYMYGLIGLTWALYMYYSIVKKSYRVLRNTGQCGLLMFSVYLIAISTTELHWYWVRSAVMTLVVFWAILQDSNEYPENFAAELEGDYYENSTF